MKEEGKINTGLFRFWLRLATNVMALAILAWQANSLNNQIEPALATAVAAGMFFTYAGVVFLNWRAGERLIHHLRHYVHGFSGIGFYLTCVLWPLWTVFAAVMFACYWSEYVRLIDEETDRMAGK